MAKRKKSAPARREPASFEIKELRGIRVILDTDIAKIYNVPTRRLRQQFHRNPQRFPPDFAFELSKSEIGDLKLELDAADPLGVRRSIPIAFTELGALMVATILRCEEAVATSIFIMRAFVELRNAMTDTPQHASRLDEIEQNNASRKDGQIETFEGIYEDLKRLLNPERPRQRRIGFVVPEKGGK